MTLPPSFTWPAHGTLTLVLPHGPSDYARIDGYWRSADGAVLRRIHDCCWQATFLQWTSGYCPTPDAAMAAVDAMGAER